MQSSSLFSRWSLNARAGLLLAVVALVLAGALLGAYAYVAWDWREHAFAGFLPTRELAVSHDEPFSNDERHQRRIDQLAAYESAR